MIDNTTAVNIQFWLDAIADYERSFSDWENKSQTILKRYKDEGSETRKESRYNILWSNVQTLKSATFARVPKPDVSRRFSDPDPIGRTAALILERALEYEVEKYPEYASTLEACVLDRFLGGRGTAWVRYEPHFRAPQQQQGEQITEDMEVQDELDYECAPCDYVHWKDFGHVMARRWEEVPAVWRKVYLDRDQCIERFGEDLGPTIPLDAKPEADKNKEHSDKAVACVYEIWDKRTKQAIWLSKSMKQTLDVKPDPLELDDFFPCPKPLYATLTNDSMVPTPDFKLYQDQANDLDTLSNRINGLVEALKVMGVYDASTPELSRLFTEGQSGTLIPVQNWAKFAEKAGLKGSVDIVDLTMIINALRESYIAVDQIKQQIYDIFGISDIIRGQSNPNETLGAQQLKGQYAGLRLTSYQDQVARFATELLQIKAQIMCKQFSPQTLVQISAADQLRDKELIMPAVELLTQKGPNPVRGFRIEIQADSLIVLDEQQEKENRVEFLTSVSQFMNNIAPAVQMAPQILPLAAELLKFGVRGFKVGKSIEQAFEVLDQPPPPSPTEDEMKQLDQAKKDVQMGQDQLKQLQDEIRSEAQKLEQKKNDIEKAQLRLEKTGVELDKKALQIGFDESSLEMDRQFDEQTRSLQKEHERELSDKTQENNESKLSQAADTLSAIADGVQRMSENHVALTAEASMKLADAIGSLNELVKNQTRKRKTRVTKDKSGSWVSEELE